MSGDARDPDVARRAARAAEDAGPLTGWVNNAAVDHGPDGIRANAVGLGSITTARSEAYRAAHPEDDVQLTALHPGPDPEAR